MSGGMRQRAMIALALACRPQLLLADEPTTALDATVQIQVLLLLRELQRELGLGVIFVTHDIGVAVEVADRIAVMYAGKLVEMAPVERMVDAPQHPYSRGLLASTVHDGMRGQRLDSIPGAPPDLAEVPAGCSFAQRCSLDVSECSYESHMNENNGLQGSFEPCRSIGTGSGLRIRECRRKIAPAPSWNASAGTVSRR
jgi:peptide/nickel transport system ATP-binding protein